MSAPEPHTARDIAAAVAAGSCTAAQVLDQARVRIGRCDPPLNCFTATTFERASAEAARIDARRAAGAPLPPLAGVPFAVKNLFDIAGEVTLAGARVNAAAAPAPADACLVQRLGAAGGVLVGALNMDEHAYGFTTENTHFGATRNPHDPARIAGGSSGGSAAAVAAGMVPLALGSDTNGSIRVPASLCGVFGLKPTYGRLSRRGTYPFVHSLDHVGLFATGVADLAAAYDALQGPDAADRACAQRPCEPVGGPHLPAPGIRIAVLGGWFHDWAGAQARAAVARAAAALGARATEVLAGARAARAAAYVITAAEGGALHRERLRTRYAEFEPLSRDRLVAGSLIPSAWVVQAQRARRHVFEQALALFERVDLLIAPATPVAAPAIGTETMQINGEAVPVRAGMGLLTQPISCLGLPVCVAPMWPGSSAATSGGTPLPIGVQLIAPPWREDLCLGAAHALERAGVACCRIAAAGLPGAAPGER
jgi:aspartyl-tRNA(Asn)/glutamyl-tRNA(Gln) amidotransferase subunit A